MNPLCGPQCREGVENDNAAREDHQDRGQGVAHGAVRGVTDGGGRGSSASVPDHLGSDTQIETGQGGVGMTTALPYLGPEAGTSGDGPGRGSERVARSARNMLTDPARDHYSP